MTLEERIYKDYVEALKAKDKAKTDFLSFIRAELKNAAIDLRKEKLDDNEVFTVLKKQKKRLYETKESIVSSGREDLLKDVDRELALLSEYLPPPLAENELTEIINQVISEVNALSMKDMGRVMKGVLAKTGARADSKHVSELVRNKLSSFLKETN